MTIPQQAVILCGGLGTRMRPLTDSMPKPMVSINGRPFLEYLIGQMREQGIRRVLLLTGYLGETIRDYFGDGDKFGVQISYSYGPVSWDTGRRIWEARAQVDERFLLLYSDNYTSFNLQKLVAFHSGRAVILSLILYPKTPGNISVGEDGRVERYDASRGSRGFDYVELGYMIVERDAMLAYYGDPDVSFSRILQKLAQDRMMAGLVAQDVYHSISDPKRYKLAEQYLAVKRILLIDRDGTINRRPPPGEYVTRWEDFCWVPDTVEGMRRLAAAGFTFIVLSNQAGIGRGVLKAEVVHGINKRMIEELRNVGVEVLDVYICPHHWNDGCACRKPAPGLFFAASRDHLIRLDRTVYIGDDPRDAEAASNAECDSILIGETVRMEPGKGAPPIITAPTLVELVPPIVSHFEQWERAVAPQSRNPAAALRAAHP